MTDFYADSSVLVKRHIHEAGSDWFHNLTASPTDNIIITSRISLVEVYSAFNRRHREAHLSQQDYTQLLGDFSALCQNEYQLLEVTATIIERARHLLEVHPLRAYDAVQLASALLANEALQAGELAALTFLAADSRLLDVAQAEGLATDNPNAYG